MPTLPHFPSLPTILAYAQPTRYPRRSNPELDPQRQPWPRLGRFDHRRSGAAGERALLVKRLHHP
ncbi:hypothetical protein CEN41_01795 [Fischerella thermalis CCMEE 5330]|uniref:Uncharacterized protein n=1 Tax=Fischerella thermalis CCMEE 5330 TaxID=2019670 RepID=A0A2N6MNE1_9CYAN|nr:hypothetical protein CEN41_01795 [Fischerella thermalis CCMEE 5330]